MKPPFKLSASAIAAVLDSIAYELEAQDNVDAMEAKPQWLNRFLETAKLKRSDDESEGNFDDPEQTDDRQERDRWRAGGR